jgi:hypothetical protein
VVLTGPPTLDAKATQLVVEARVIDGGGVAMARRAPIVDGIGATLAPAKELADGRWTLTAKIPASTFDVQLGASPPADPTGLAPVRLLAWPDQTSLLANGASTTWLNVVAVDRLGQGVPGVEVRLAVPGGQGLLPATATTGANGLTRVPFTAGTRPGLAQARAEAAGTWTVAPIALTSTADPVAFPLTTPPDHAEAVRRWRAAAPSLRWTRDGAPPPPPVPTAPPVGVSGVWNNPEQPPPPPAPIEAAPSAAPAEGAAPTPLPEAAVPAVAAAAAPAPANDRSRVRSSPPSARLGLVLTNAHGSFRQTSDGTDGALGGARFDAPALGFTGLAARTDAFGPEVGPGVLGIDAAASARLDWTRASSGASALILPDARVLAVWRYGDRALRPAASLGVHLLSAPLYRYTDASLAEVSPERVVRAGARLGARLYAEAGRLSAVLEVAETFAPLPADTHASLLGDLALGDGPWAARAVVAYDAIALRDRGADARLRRGDLTVSAGIGAGF